MMEMRVLGLQQAMRMQNVNVSLVHKVIYNYPHLTRHTSTLQWLYTVNGILKRYMESDDSPIQGKI
jgi:hypothetical protein